MIIKILLTPICFALSFIGGLIMGLFLLIEKPFELAITSTGDLWSND